MAEERASTAEEEPMDPDPSTLDGDAPGSDMGAGWQEAVPDLPDDRDESGVPGVGDVYRSGS